MIKRILYLAAVGTILWTSSSSEEALPPGVYAEIDTNRGIIKISLDSSILAAANFVGLAEGTIPNDARPPGKPYFDDQTFYRDAPGYAVFSGDPGNDGTGDSGYTLPRDQIPENDVTLQPGTILMDGLPSESSGSRFFILRQEDRVLARKYTAFGEIVSGMNVLRRIVEGDRIKSIRIIRVGNEANAFQIDKDTFETMYAESRMNEIEALGRIDPNLSEVVINLGDTRQKTITGIYYSVKEEGQGENPKSGSAVSIHYSGSLVDGTVFDESRQRGQTYNLVLGKDGIIAGWIEMIKDMKKGEKRIAVIPPSMAYGEKGYGPIEPDTWLVFEIELVEVSMEG